MKVKCPTCSASAEYDPKNPYRPFCSERCRTLDLGAWADEQYRVPAREQEGVSVNEKSRAHGPDDDPTPPKHHLN